MKTDNGHKCSESMEHLKLSTFFNAIDTNKYGDLFVQLSQLKSLFPAGDPNLDLISLTSTRFEDEIANVLPDLDNFKITGSSRNSLFE